MIAFRPRMMKIDSRQLFTGRIDRQRSWLLEALWLLKKTNYETTPSIFVTFNHEGAPVKKYLCRRVSGFSHLSIYVIYVIVIFLAVCPPWLPGWVTLALCKRSYLMLCFYNMFSLMNDKEGRSTQRVLRVSSTINLVWYKWRQNTPIHITWIIKVK